VNSFSDYLAHGNAWLYIPAAIVLGALHGLEPGHSKTMMAAFIVAIRGTVKQAVLLGLAATVSHTAIIWILAPIGLYYSGYFNVEELEPYFQVAAGLIIIGMAAWTFVRTRQDQRAAASHSHSTHTHGPHGGVMIDTGHGQMEISVFETGVPPRFRLYFYDSTLKPLSPPTDETIALETIRPDGARQLFAFVHRGEFLEASENLPEPHEFDVLLKLEHAGHVHAYKAKFEEDHHHHHGHEHDHPSGLPDVGSEEYADAHERAHAIQIQERFTSRQVTTGQIALFGLTGGLMPCSAAVAVLLICLQLKRFVLGFALVLAFSIGLAITLVTAGAVAAISVRQASKRFKGFGELARKAPYFSASVMGIIGLLFCIQGARRLLH